MQCEHNELVIKHEKLCGDYARLQEHNTHQKRQLETQGSQVSELQGQLKHVQDQLEKQEQAAFAQAGGMFVSGFSGNTIFPYIINVMLSRQFLDVVGLLYFCSIYVNTYLNIIDDNLWYRKALN